MRASWIWVLLGVWFWPLAVAGADELADRMAEAHRIGGKAMAVITYEVDNGMGARRFGATGICILAESGSAVLMTLGMDSQTPMEFYVPGTFEAATPGVNGPTLKAELIGVDPATGVGFVRVTGEYDWEAVQFAQKSDLTIGETVVSVGMLEPNLGGAPYAGFGRVSSITQSPETTVCVALGGLTRPGSLVFNEEGEVVGVVGPQWFINTQLMIQDQLVNAGQRGQHWTMCFMPVEEFISSLNPIPDSPQDFRQLGWPGVLRGEGVSENEWSSYGIDRPGVILHTVVPGRCGERAGLKDLDIIVGINGNPLPRFATPDMTANHTFRTLGQMGAGAEVTLNVIRDSSPMDCKVTLEAAPRSPRAARMTIDQKFAIVVREKVEMDPLVDTSATGQTPGVVVVQVDENGPAGRAGIKSDDTITAIDGEKVTTTEFFQTRLKDALQRGGTMEVMVSREGRDTGVIVQIPQATETPAMP